MGRRIVVPWLGAILYALKEAVEAQIPLAGRDSPGRPARSSWLDVCFFAKKFICFFLLKHVCCIAFLFFFHFYLAK